MSQSEALRLYVAHAIEAKHAGDASAYVDVLQQLEDPASARKLLKGLIWCINLVTVADWDLIDHLVKLLYLHTNNEKNGELIVKAVVAFVSSNPAVFLPKCYEVLVFQFTAQVDPTTGAPPADRSADEDPRIKWAMECIHSIISQLLSIFVASSSIFLSVLKAVYPYKALARPIQRAFLRNLLRVAEYAPGLRDDILGLAVLKLMEIDVEIKLEDAVDDDHELFDMDGHEHMPWPEDEAARAAMQERAQTVSVEADKLDDLMTIMFDHLRSVFAPADPNAASTSSPPRSPSGSPPRGHRYPIPPPAPSAVFRALLASFESTVLTTWKCKYVQFLLFYACSFRPREFADLFLERLFGRLEAAGGRQESQMSAAYLGSFVGRAAFLEPASVRSALSHLLRWAHAYVDAHDATVAAPDAGKHGVFYMVCQSAFYVLCYKWELLEEAPDLGGRERNLAFLRGLRLQRVIDSRLNPLKMCLATVVQEFTRVCHSLDIAHCSAVVRRNRSLVIPTRTGAAGGAANELDAFFPFDPYLLKRSHPFVDPLYQTWRDTPHKDSQSETSSASSSDEEDDEEEAADDGGAQDDLGDLRLSRSLNLGPSPMATSLLSRSSPLTAASPAPSSGPEESDADPPAAALGASPDPMSLSTTPLAPSLLRPAARGRPPRGGLAKAGSGFAVSSPQLAPPGSGLRGGPCRRRLRSPTPSPIP